MMAHPVLYLLMPFVMAVVMIRGFSGWLHGDWWKSLLLGLLSAMPAMLWQKRLMRRHSEFFAQLHVSRTASVFGIVNARMEATTLLYSLHFLLYAVAFLVLAWRLGVSPVPGWMAPSFLCFLLYHEQREIHELVVRSLAESEN